MHLSLCSEQYASIENEAVNDPEAVDCQLPLFSVSRKRSCSCYFILFVSFMNVTSRCNFLFYVNSNCKRRTNDSYPYVSRGHTLCFGTRLDMRLNSATSGFAFCEPECSTLTHILNLSHHSITLVRPARSVHQIVAGRGVVRRLVFADVIASQ